MKNNDKLRICLVSSELTPLAKTGGLADVSAALATYLHEAGHDVRVLIPCYSRIDESGLDIQPVSELSNMSLKFGDVSVDYSIDKARLPGTTLTIYLLRCDAAYGRPEIYSDENDEHLRFTLLSRAALEMCQRQQFSPDIFSCHDWQTALIPLYLQTMYAWDRLFHRSKSVLTIHNIGYQGMFPASALPQLALDGAEHHLHQDDLRSGVINFLKTGILYADIVSTVSPTYAREILGDEYGMGLNPYLAQRADSVVGILNGVDYSEWDPATDPLIPANYSRKDMRGKQKCKQALCDELGIKGDIERPLIGIVSRLAGQKGLDLVQNVIPRMLTQRDFSFVVLGSGEAQLEQRFHWMQHHFRDRVCFYQGYNNKLAHWIEAGSDMFLMPSRYEPCGLNQMYSLKYGTVPIVRETGGLADSVTQIDADDGSGTGVLFRDFNEQALEWAVNRALDLYANKTLWKTVVDNGMAKNFSWQAQGPQYVELFRKLANR